MSFISKTFTDIIYQNTADLATLSSFTTEASLLTAGTQRRAIPANHFSIGTATTIMVEAWGIIACTGTPTYTFTVRMGTAAAWSASDTSLAASTTITMQSGVSNQHWYLQANISCDTFGVGTGLTTLRCNGFVESPGGFAAPYKYAMAPSAAALQTWSATIDGSLNQFVGVSVACSANSASNTITAKRVIISGRN